MSTTVASHQIVRLGAGRHRSPDEGACVMELASMLAGEPFSDHPRAVDAGLGAFLRTYNDGLDDERRQDLYALAAAVVGTRGRTFARRRRARFRQELRELGDRRPGWFDEPGIRLARLCLRAGDDGHRRVLAVVADLTSAPAGAGEPVRAPA